MILAVLGGSAGLTSSFPASALFFPRAIDKCELVVKDLYSKLGLQYRESSSEDEDSAAKAMEVIEILDEEDEDVVSVDVGSKHSSVSRGATWDRGEGDLSVSRRGLGARDQDKGLINLALSPAVP